MKKYLLVILMLVSGKTFSQNVGIGTTAPSEKLHVAGNIKTDTLKSNAIRFTPNAAAGKVLTSDVNGNASWQTAGAGSVNAFNGLIKTNDSVKLGGALTENSVVRLNARSFTITDTGAAITQFINQPSNPLGTALGAASVTQTFTATANSKLASVELFITAFGGSSITLQLKDNNGAITESVTNNYVSTINNWSPFTFSTAVLNGGGIFTLLLTATGTAQILYDNANPYSGGSSSIGATADIAFRVNHIIEKNLFYLKENKIGISTATPAYKLDVKGSINTDSVYRIGGERVLAVNQLNTIVGISAAKSNTTGNYNTAAGYEALFSNTIGERNTAFGLWALRNNVSGNYNTAVGKSALHDNSTGHFNTATGYEALFDNTAGVENTAVGYQSMLFNTAGFRNTATGNQTLYSNSTGNYNAAHGIYALYYNSTGSNNTANGAWALYFNGTGSSNTASGYQALYHNTSGSNNTANGNKALFNNTTGYSNIASGDNALSDNTIGIVNTAVGVNALSNNTTGNGNTAIGYNALINNGVYGNNNTALGSGAGTINSSLGYNNSTAIGSSAIVDGSDRVRIGNTTIESIGGQVSWTTFSDGRYKQNLLEDVPGIAFINKLRPVTYTVDIKSLNENYYKLNPDIADAANTSYRHTGFIAQEVERSATELGFSFSGVDKPQESGKLYGLRYAEFVVPLVKAVQELSIENDELKKQSVEMLRRIEKLELLIASKIN